MGQMEDFVGAAKAKGEKIMSFPYSNETLHYATTVRHSFKEY
jgi:hypothetical protein